MRQRLINGRTTVRRGALHGAALCGSLVLSGCVLPPDEDPVQIRMNDLDGRIQKIERIVSNQSLVELSQRLEALEADARRLRGELDIASNETGGTRKAQRDLYADLDKRLAALEGARGYGAGELATLPPGAASGRAGELVYGPSQSSNAAPGAGAALSGSAASVAAGGAAEQRAYDSAFEALKGGQYPSAITQFGQFLGAYPRSALAENAQYWLGEAHYVTRNYGEAVTAFERVGEQWPGSRKAADALLKLGFSQYELKQFDQARQTLSEVVTRFPGSDAARLAQERLQRLVAERR